MTTLHGGRTLFGHAVGILMLDTAMPRMPGDVGNARTWPFAVHYRVVRGADTTRIMGPEPDPALLEPFIEAARELEADGVGVIATSCGFLAIFQREIAAAVSIPVVTSALLAVPFAAQAIGPGRRVGILTERPTLTERHFEGVGWSSRDTPVVVQAMPEDAIFPTVFIDQALEAETDVLRSEVVALGERLVRERPDVGALVLECTNFVPWSADLRRVTGLPVFDLFTLVATTVQAVSEPRLAIT